MALNISGSVVMAEVMAFNDRLTKAAKSVDISGMDVYHTINTNIGNQCLAYSLDKRRVEVSVQHTDMMLTYYLDRVQVLDSTFPQREMDAQVNGALRWLLGMPICLDPLPQETIRIESPEDGKDYSTVDLVVQINSSFEVSKLYAEVKEKGWVYQQDMGGPLKMVGTIAKHQLWVMPQIHTINGVKVLYIQPTSAFVHWDMVEEWVKQRVPEDTPMLSEPGRMICEIRDIADSRKEAA
jgi:hypothetical protein